MAAFDRTVNGYEFGLAQIDAFAEEHGKAIAITELGASGADAGAWFDEVQEWAAGQDNLAFVNVWYDGPESGYDGRSNPAAVGELLAEGVGGGTPSQVQRRHPDRVAATRKGRPVHRSRPRPDPGGREPPGAKLPPSRRFREGGVPGRDAAAAVTRSAAS